jgi:hypothetical protein
VGGTRVSLQRECGRERGATETTGIGERKDREERRRGEGLRGREKRRYRNIEILRKDKDTERDKKEYNRELTERGVEREG